MITLDYTYAQKKRASTLLSLSLTELEAADILVERELYREALTHMYQCCFHASHALLVAQVGSSPSHKSLDAELQRADGSAAGIPRRYVELHALLLELRTHYAQHPTHSPAPAMLTQKLRVLHAWVSYAFRRVPKLETHDILRALLASNEHLIRDFSYDIYCPKTYSHHTRLTLWQPPFYLEIFSAEQMQAQARRMLLNLRVRRANDYVVGINSRLDQYGGVHLVMLDIDTLDPTVEARLRTLGGVLLKSGRGFHFIGNTVIEGQREWEALMRQLKRDRELRPYIDHDHIDISLRRGYATLRVTASKAKPKVPVFYKEL